MLKLIQGQKKFYQEKYSEFGDDPRSLSHNDRESQYLRFKILSGLFRYESSPAFSVHEVGCGLAHFGTYLKEKKIRSDYSGSDISEDFIRLARAKFPKSQFALQDISKNFHKIDASVKGKDYYLLSGTFNTINENCPQEWEAFLVKTLSNMFRMCRKGIGFNCLTSYSQPAYRRKSLYYADPKKIYDWCHKNLSRFVTVTSDSPLYEFTVFVYQKDFIKSLHPSGFDKYFRSEAS